MLQSKAIKEFTDEKSSKIYSWWIGTAVSKWYYDFTWKFFGKPIERVKKVWGWYWNVFRFDYDFDGHSLFAIIEYKLQRLEKVLIKGHAIQEPQDMKALKTAIKLAGRLKDDKYEIPFYERHNRKWGEMRSKFVPDKKTGSTKWLTSRPKAKTKKQQEEELKEFRAYYIAAEAQQKREEKNLYSILSKYLRNWWD
jgi:hypothetical protein